MDSGVFLLCLVRAYSFRYITGLFAYSCPMHWLYCPSTEGEPEAWKTIGNSFGGVMVWITKCLRKPFLELATRKQSKFGFLFEHGSSWLGHDRNWPNLVMPYRQGAATLTFDWKLIFSDNWQKHHRQWLGSLFHSRHPDVPVVKTFQNFQVASLTQHIPPALLQLSQANGWHHHEPRPGSRVDPAKLLSLTPPMIASGFVQECESISKMI